MRYQNFWSPNTEKMFRAYNELERKHSIDPCTDVSTPTPPKPHLSPVDRDVVWKDPDSEHFFSPPSLSCLISISPSNISISSFAFGRRHTIHFGDLCHWVLQEKEAEQHDPFDPLLEQQIY